MTFEMCLFSYLSICVYSHLQWAQYGHVIQKTIKNENFLIFTIIEQISCLDALRQIYELLAQCRLVFTMS